MITRALVVGGAHGLGLEIAKELASRETTEIVYIVDINIVEESDMMPKMMSFPFDLTNERYAFFDRFTDIDGVFMTASVKDKGHFQEIPYTNIIHTFNVNTIPVLRLIDKFYGKLMGKEDFYCAVNISTMGLMPVPMYSVYGASKAALKSFIDTVNAELKNAGCINRITGIISMTSENAPRVSVDNDIKGIIEKTEAKWELCFPLAD